MIDRVGRGLEAVLFAGRWLLVPIYLAMLAALAMLAVTIVLKVAETVPKLMGLGTDDVLLFILSLIDLSLTANLLVMVMLGGWENFVSPNHGDRAERPAWLGHLDFAAMKRKLASSIAAIAGVEMLEVFLHARDAPDPQLIGVKLALYGGFILATLILAWADRIGGSH